MVCDLTDMNHRTNLAIKNIGISAFLKGASMLIYLVLVPLTLGYLNDYEYGIWLTLNSVISWIYLLDLGLGNGLRNKLAESIAKNDMDKGRVYVSTTIFFMTLIIVVFYALFLLSNFFFDWYDIMNVSPARVSNLKAIVIIVFGMVCMNFVLKIVGNIYMSYQLPAVNDFLVFMGSFLSLVVIFILTKTTSGSLMDVALTFSVSPVIVYLVAYVYTFRRYPDIKPSLRCVKRQYFSELITVGLYFLLIQVSFIVIHLTSNILISNIFGPEEVTPYNLAYKLFSTVATFYGVILSPVWSSVTDAFARNDIPWIFRSIRQLCLIWFIEVLVAVILVVLSPWVFKIWVGDEVVIPFSLSVLCAAFFLIYTFGNIFINIVNGIGKLKVQMIFSVFEAVVFVPLAIVLAKKIGIDGVMIATICVIVLNLLWAPYQSIALLKGKAKGIWNQ